MRRTMKKYIFGMLVASVMLVTAIGCGKTSEGEDVTGENTSGDAIVINETPHATDEMNAENEAAQEEIAAKAEAIQPVPEGQIVVSPDELNEPALPEVQIQEELPETKDENRLQLVFLGDSILDGYRDQTGIVYLTGVNCDADVYNLSMGGTTASLTTYEKSEYENWTSRSLQGVVHAITGNVKPDIMNGYRAGEVFASCDFSKTDYFIIEYGMNDFLSGTPLNDEEDYYDEYTYVGSLRIAIDNLKRYYPDAQIILCSPNYAQFWGSNGAFLGDGNMVNNGGGTLAEYYRVCGNVSSEFHTLFLNAYEGIGLDTYTADEYLEDGIHLSEKGRFEYARILSSIIMENEATRNN